MPRIATYGAAAPRFPLRSQPSDVAVLIDPVNGTTERPMEIVRSPLLGTVGFDGNRNSSTIKADIHFEVRIDGGIALPRSLELALVD